MIRIPPRVLLPLTVLVFALSAWYGASLDLSDFVTDDGGITLRYAERIAEGRGFNYNDGEAINGSSNPLYTLVLAGLLALGLSPQAAILAIAIPALAATTALLFHAFARYWSLFAALLSIPVYWSAEFVLNYQFDALEPTFTILFAALLFLALHTHSRTFQGVCLGLLVANKLDGALAPIAFTLLWIVLERRFPWRQAVSALAAAAPVFLVLLVSFGSILPNSMLTKLGAETVKGFDPFWMVNNLRYNLPEFAIPALLSFLLPVPEPGPARLARGVVQLWLTLVLVAYATIDLGDPYPWYIALPAFLIVILAVITVHSIFHGVATVTAAGAAALRASTGQRIARVLGVGMLAIYGLYEPLPAILDRVRDPERPDRVKDIYASEIARQAGGAWLRKYTDGTEVFWSHFGLPSFEYKGPVFDGSRLNSPDDPTALERAPYAMFGPYVGDMKPPPTYFGKDLVGLFRYSPKAQAYAVYARADSQIARAGRTHFGFHFQPREAFDALARTPAVPGQHFRIVEGVLHQTVPSALAFVFEAPDETVLTFTPRHPRREVGADGGASWSVQLDGQIVASGELRPGEPTRLHRVKIDTESPRGLHRILFRVDPIDPDRPPRHFAWAHLSGAPDAPLTSDDFRVLCDPWARRIDAVEGAR
ncbi:MAG: hypothetical protein JNK02_00530 [Planctomycetes bacterium]|nr:hypothetical protein [Planctomycetota bacterium]